MVTMEPMFIMTLITSAALIDIFCASSATVIVSGIATSCTMGAVGLVKPCSAVVTAAVFLGLAFFLRRPALSPLTCNSLRPYLVERFSSRSLAPFLARPRPSGCTSGTCWVEIDSACLRASSSALRCSSASLASSLAFSSASSSARRLASCSSIFRLASSSRSCCSASMRACSSRAFSSSSCSFSMTTLRLT